MSPSPIEVDVASEVSVFVMVLEFAIVVPPESPAVIPSEDMPVTAPANVAPAPRVNVPAVVQGAVEIAFIVRQPVMY